MKKKWIGAALCAALFCLLIVLICVCDVAAIGPEGTRIGLSHLNGAVRDAVGVNMTLYSLTKWCGIFAIAVAAGILLYGGIRWIREKRVKREILGVLLLFAALAVFYALFEIIIVNRRPILMAGETYPEASFPSSHTMLALGIWGGVWVLGRRLLPSGGSRTALRVFCVLMAAVTVVCRFLSGVHWITDILGGLLIGAALVLACSAFCDGGEKQE